jgi:hypothetical protein
MSFKYTILISSIFLILSSQNNSIWADYSSPSIAEEDEIEAAQARHNMAPLLDKADWGNLPSLNETTMLPKMDRAMMQEVLDKQNVADMLTPSIITEILEADFKDLVFIRMAKFSPSQDVTDSKALDDLKSLSFKEKMEKSMERLSQFFPPHSLYNILD